MEHSEAECSKTSDFDKVGPQKDFEGGVGKIDPNVTANLVKSMQRQLVAVPAVNNGQIRY